MQSALHRESSSPDSRIAGFPPWRDKFPTMAGMVSHRGGKLDILIAKRMEIRFAGRLVLKEE